MTEYATTARPTISTLTTSVPGTRERFGFGANWTRFLTLLDDDRIASAEASLREMLGVDTLAGLSFLDIGSGSGLFSLAARRLGARVHSFDYDPQSVNCTAELRRRYAPDDPAWTVEQGSVLDASYLARLGTFDLVYSWGVLHHTGAMWEAIDAASQRVAPGGLFFIAIYNDQGGPSRRWASVKRFYNRLPRPLATALVAGFYLASEIRQGAIRGLRGGNPLPFMGEREVITRGMDKWRDWVDWVGGYPFEVARPEAVFHFVQARGFRLDRMTTCGGGLGCNQFVFRRV